MINAIYQSLRNILGIRNVCIYQGVSCEDYAKHILKHKPFYKSLPLIAIRVLSCNPITAIIRKRNFR